MLNAHESSTQLVCSVILFELIHATHSVLFVIPATE